MSETDETPRVRLAPRSAGIDSDNPGLSFWNKLNPERQRSLAGSIREIEIAIAQMYPDSFKSPLVDRVDQLRKRGGLERQTDMTSCTYHATANALRVLDQPRMEYSRDQIKARTEALTGHLQVTISQSDLERVFASGTPYDQFVTRNVGGLQVRIGKAPKWLHYFRV